MRSGTWDFSDMPGLYVLTITEYDPFGYDYMMYRIKNQCVEVPESVRETLFAEKSEERLRKWLKLAARVTSMQEFEEKMR